MTIMQQLSIGPTLTKHEQGVHIIFVPPEVDDPGPDIVPSDIELDEVAAQLTSLSGAIGQSIAVTDVIVFAGKPWHLVEGRLRRHPQVHTDFQATVLKLLIERGETAVWWSEHEFEIIKIEDHDHASVTAPEPFPPPATKPDPHAPIFVARSAAPAAASRNHEYKITFKRDGRTTDPNMMCI